MSEAQRASVAHERLRQRFEGLVDRSGKHHIWLGATNPHRGTGRIKVNGRQATAHRVAWELAHGPLPNDARVSACLDEPACVRLDHLSVNYDLEVTEPTPSHKRRANRGTGSKRKIRPGVWKLTVAAGRYEDGTPRREFKTVQAASADEATAELARFVVDVHNAGSASQRVLRELTFDQAMEIFLSEHLLTEKGREPKTVNDYRCIHAKWFSPQCGSRRVRHVDQAMLDSAFGRMRKTGLSRSRMNQAKSLYAPFFRWAKARHITSTNPMLEFQLPTSRQVSKERMAPEVEELALLLSEALTVVPDVAPLLAVGAVTGMRRGELTGLRRSRIFWPERRLTVDTAITATQSVKGTKTRKERSFYVDAATMELLRMHCGQMDERASLLGTTVSGDGYLFSLEPDCSKAMPPDYVTKRVGELKDHLGIADKKPETIALEEQALALYRSAPNRGGGKSGPSPKGSLSHEEVGRRLGRSRRWAELAIRSAERREAARLRGDNLNFDGSILALRKFTSSELLDAGFNITLVAQRQGHGPQVLVKHYAKGRASADRKAADHLGRVVHARPKAK